MHALHTIIDTLERHIDLAIAAGIRRRSNRGKLLIEFLVGIRVAYDCSSK